MLWRVFVLFIIILKEKEWICIIISIPYRFVVVTLMVISMMFINPNVDGLFVNS